MWKALLLAVFVGSLIAVAQPPTGETKATEAQLIQMVRDWAKALTTKDIATLDRLTADDWTSVNPAGKVRTKTELINGLKSSDKPQESAELRDMQARIFGNTALVTGIAVQKSTVKGEERDGIYRFSDLFVKRDGKWVAVYTQTTKVSD
jgi:ketosteroid isomerase-like protein